MGIALDIRRRRACRKILTRSRAGLAIAIIYRRASRDYSQIPDFVYRRQNVPNSYDGGDRTTSRYYLYLDITVDWRFKARARARRSLKTTGTLFGKIYHCE